VSHGKPGGVMDRLINALSGILFRFRPFFIVLFALITVFFAWSAMHLRVDAGFLKMVPLEHPYMKAFTEYKPVFGGANPVIVALMTDKGDIYTKDFMATLKAATDEVTFIQGVDRPTVQSLFTPNVRFIEVVEGGFAGGNVIHATFAGTDDDLAKVRRNVEKANLVGRLVANDLKGALIRATLLDADPQTGKPFDYQAIAKAFEGLRTKFEKDGVKVYIIGNVKAVGDIADGARGVIGFFGVAFLITALLLYWYTKSLKLTAVALVCAMLPVLWLLGCLPLIGFGIDPLSILVPFLIFSIGCSHAVQMTNAFKDGIASGQSSLDAAKSAFAAMFVPGTLALLTNALGFLVIMLIKIRIVQELGITATLGVTLMIVTNKMILPIWLSYLSLSPKTIERKLAQEKMFEPLWRWCAQFAQRKWALRAIAVAVLLAVVGAWGSRYTKVGDIGVGLPELRPESRYNQDVVAITKNFAIGVDVLSVIAQSKDVDGACAYYPLIDAIDRFEWRMKNTEGVASTLSMQGLAKTINAGYNEGSPRWRTLSRNRDVMAQANTPVDTGTGLLNNDCSAMQILMFATDHQNETLAHIVQTVKDWNAEFKKDPLFSEAAPKLDFKLASGIAGVTAATNEAVEAADKQELAAIFGAITLMCLLTFRSWRATACIILPLALVSLLNNALMAWLGIGLKISTLPVIALGVGVGVDYGIYLFDRLETHLVEHEDLGHAFFHALRERGACAAFTAITMALGVGTWAFSALKLQADMGVLLAFMFLVNMLGALILLPSLLHFLPPKQFAREIAAADTAVPV
jgi:predicted RND superfamily exporter protein